MCSRRSWPRWTSTSPSRSRTPSARRWTPATAATRDKGELGDAYAGFAAARLGWAADPALVVRHPRRDDRHRRGHYRADPARRRPWPSTRRSTRRSSSGSRLAARWCRGAAPQLRRPLRPRPRRARPGPGRRGRPRLPAVQPAQPGRPGLVPRRSCSPSPTCARGTAPRCWWTRSTPRWCCPAPVRAVRLPGPPHDRAGHRVHLGHQGLEHPRPQVRRGRRRVAGRRPRCWSERWDALLAAQLGVLASVAAFTSARPWLDAMLAQIDENRRLLTAPAGRATCPASATSRPRPASWPGWTAARWASATTRPRRSWSAAGSRSARARTSATPGRGYARLNIGTSPALIGEAVKRMAAAVS